MVHYFPPHKLVRDFKNQFAREMQAIGIHFEAFFESNWNAIEMC